MEKDEKKLITWRGLLFARQILDFAHLAIIRVNHSVRIYAIKVMERYYITLQDII